MLNLFYFPSGFWLSAAVLIGVAWWGWEHRKKGWGLPAIGVCLTVLVWYQGDAIYNDYVRTYAEEFPAAVLSEAWMQVALFALAFGVFVHVVSNLINANYLDNPSRVEALLSGRRSLASLQPALERLATALGFVWLIIFGVALWRTNWDVMGLIAPYLGELASPWARSQVAASWFDSIATVLGTLAMLCAGLFGVCATMLKSGWARWLMIVLSLVSWPSYFLDRTRNVMLVVLLPGLLALTFFRWRGRRLMQTALLIAVFIGLNAWFKFVITNRPEGSIVTAFVSKSARLEQDTGAVKHAGLNMFEELCWINHLITEGIYTPVRGQLYVANIVNPIPRALWPGKPTMGLDYAIARGQGGDTSSGVTATVAVGMIGSGVVNFGKLLGPVAAAFLMSLWCAFLARLDLTGQDPGRLLIYLIGNVLIFNFGRDITFLVAYPALFGFALLWVWRKVAPQASAVGKPAQAANRQPSRQSSRRPLGRIRS